MAEKKNILTYAGLQKLEEELHDLKVYRRKEVIRLNILGPLYTVAHGVLLASEFTYTNTHSPAMS